MPSSDQRAVVRLRVEGMRCHSCEQVLTAWLSDIPGIEAVLANHANGQVVIYSAQDVPVEAMLTAIVRGIQPRGAHGADRHRRGRCGRDVDRGRPH